MPHQEEKTFRDYSQKQGEAYASARPGYPTQIFQYILEHHASTGGQHDLIVDVGCGPGRGLFILAPNFKQAVGLDPSQGMITTARTATSNAGGPKPRFEISSAETLGADLEPPIADGSVDLITAATAAHWFDMDRFWPSAARVLKPGGTVAIWCGGRPFVADSTPNAEAIRAVMKETFEGEELAPYQTIPNIISQGLYAELSMPWTLEKPVEAFDEDAFYRKVWQNQGGEDTLVPPIGMKLDRLEAAFSTMSQVTKWRQANPEKAETKEDILTRMTKRVTELLHEAGVKEGEEELTGGMPMVLMMIKKKA